MPTNIQIVDPVWTNKGVQSQNIRGNQDDLVSFSAKLRIHSYLNLTGDYYINANAINYPDGGFLSFVSVGDTMILSTPTGSTAFAVRFDVESVTDNIIYFTNVQAVSSGGTLGSGTVTAGDHTLYTYSLFKGLLYNYSLKDKLIENSYTSDLDGSLKGYSIDDITTAYKFANKYTPNVESLGLQVKFLNRVLVPLDAFAQDLNFNLGQEFEIYQEFYIQNYSQAQQIDIQDNKVPLEYLGDGTLNYNAFFEFYRDLKSPETKRVSSYRSEGNIGWYNERLNTNITPYSITNLTFSKGGQPTTGLSNLALVDFSFNLNSSSPEFTNASLIYLDHKSLLDLEDYEQVKTPYVDLFRVRNITLTTNNFSSGNFVDCKFTVINANQVLITGKFNLNDVELDDKGYLLTVDTGQIRTIVSNSIYVGGFDVEGLVTNVDLKIKTPACTGYFDKLNLMLDERLTIKALFELNQSADSIMEEAEFRWIATNGTNNYTVYSIPLDVAGLQIVDNIQVGETDSVRLVSGNQYEAIIETFVPSQSNIRNSEIGDDLVDLSLENSNKNINVFTKQINGYNICLSLYLVVSNNIGSTTEYLFKTQDLEIFNYETQI